MTPIESMTDTELAYLFAKCIRVRRTKNGWSIRCKLGLWGASAPLHSAALREAVHYWRQYFSDGEYDALLNAKRGAA